MKKALIIGHTGQDGTYLSQLLKEKNYSLAGISSSQFTGIENKTDIRNYEQVSSVVKSLKPDEIYFLAAVHQSSSDKPIEDGELFQRSVDVNVKSLVNFLEAVRSFSSNSKFFYAVSSHIFGNPAEFPQKETTPLNPNCVYGITKTTGLQICRFYRENHNVFASVGIFYNHESPLRESKYVSKKIVETAVAIKFNKKNELVLGSLEAEIDWGYAPDYIEAVHSMMHLQKPDDFIISSGKVHTIQDFVENVFTHLQLDWKKYVKLNPSLITKKQKKNLVGSYEKIMKATGWKPKVNFSTMVKILVDHELNKYASK